MKISGKFILKVAGTLTVIALVVAALLGVVNNVTRSPSRTRRTPALP